MKLCGWDRCSDGKVPVNEGEALAPCGECAKLAEERCRQSIEEREPCPIIEAHCDYYGYQCDSNGEVAISYCSHTDNPTEVEGNCTHALCPLSKED